MLTFLLLELLLFFLWRNTRENIDNIFTTLLYIYSALIAVYRESINVHIFYAPSILVLQIGYNKAKKSAQDEDLIDYHHMKNGEHAKWKVVFTLIINRYMAIEFHQRLRLRLVNIQLFILTKELWHTNARVCRKLPRSCAAASNWTLLSIQPYFLYFNEQFEILVLIKQIEDKSN